MSDIRVRLREWRVVSPSSEPRLAGLVLTADERRLAEPLRQGVLELTELREGLRVRAFAHVGRVQIGRLRITVEPKVAPTDLLELLRYAFDLRPRRFDRVPIGTAGGLLADLIAEQLLEEVEALVRGGLSRRYVARTEELASPRGRIDSRALARSVSLGRSAITCIYHRREPDHLLNRVVLAGIRLARRIARGAHIQFGLARVATQLGSEIAPLRLSATTLQRAGDHIDRTTSAYQPSLTLIGILVAASGVSLDDGTSVPLSGFMLDLNHCFQALVNRLLHDGLNDVEVRDERGLAGMVRFVPGRNPRGRAVRTPRPDFALARGGTVVGLLDAKYRDLWERDLPRDMLYQLALYAMSRPGSTAAIIYPATAHVASEAVIELRAVTAGAPLGFVAIRPLKIGELLAALRSDSMVARSQIARGLAFGVDS